MLVLARACLEDDLVRGEVDTAVLVLVTEVSVSVEEEKEALEVEKRFKKCIVEDGS